MTRDNQYFIPIAGCCCVYRIELTRVKITKQAGRVLRCAPRTWRHSFHPYLRHPSFLNLNLECMRIWQTLNRKIKIVVIGRMRRDFLRITSQARPGPEVEDPCWVPLIDSFGYHCGLLMNPGLCGSLWPNSRVAVAGPG